MRKRRRRRTRRSTRKKIYTFILIMALIMGAGYLERGWVDVPGAAVMLLLGAPMLIAWIHEENETRPEGRAR